MSKQDNSVTHSDLEEHKQELRGLLGHSLFNTVQIGEYTYALYLEHDTEEDRREGKHNGNVTALYLDNGTYKCDTGRAVLDLCYEAASGIYFAPDSPCQSTSVSVAWLRDCCRPIREAKAREIHPRLFEYLEYEPEPKGDSTNE